MLGYRDDAPYLYFDSLSQVRMSRWSNGRVAFLGDAAACASLLAGMGTSIAIIGAYTLAGELHRAAGDHGVAFDRYETAMRPFVAEAQKMATDSVQWFVPKTRLRLWLSGKLWSWMPASALKELMVDQPDKVARLVPLVTYA